MCLCADLYLISQPGELEQGLAYMIISMSPLPEVIIVTIEISTIWRGASYWCRIHNEQTPHSSEQATQAATTVAKMGPRIKRDSDTTVVFFVRLKMNWSKMQISQSAHTRGVLVKVTKAKGHVEEASFKCKVSAVFIRFLVKNDTKGTSLSRIVNPKLDFVQLHQPHRQRIWTCSPLGVHLKACWR